MKSLPSRLARRSLRLLLVAAAARQAVGSPVSLRFVPTFLPPGRAGAVENVAVVLRTETAPGKHAISLRGPASLEITPEEQEIALSVRTDTPVFFKVRYAADVFEPAVVAAVVDGKPSATLPVGGGYDLEALAFRARHAENGVGEKEGWMRPGFDDSTWRIRTIPAVWDETGPTWLRTRILVPESWQGRSLELRLAAVDDADVCYLNGQEIGRTDGWNRPRVYRIDPESVRFGETNLLCIVVFNHRYGGGIYKSPNRIGIAFPPERELPPVRLPPPGPVGDPLPLRPMRVENGVLRYRDGDEVALWGVNYYPQSWYQYMNMKRLGVDFHEAIRRDLDDMVRMGAEVVRIHVFDREISDREGNLVDNEHLELLDYLVAEGTKRGLYFFFTPIAWWWSPEENPESFSCNTPKEYMFCDPPAVAAQANYLQGFLNHRNRYTGRRYREEPSLCVLEIMNEPRYVGYDLMKDPEAKISGMPRERIEPCRRRLLAQWNRWCRERGFEDEKRFFPLFRYERFRAYLETMHRAIRETGARQPVACALFETGGRDDLVQAVADSPCEAVTTGDYAGVFGEVGEEKNYLRQTRDTPLDARLNRKARFVYEFDGIMTSGSYLYPAFARRFRNAGVQVCAMFQYDSRSTAEWNTDWESHYLNLFYTPGKAVSFTIAGRVFRETPRGAMYAVGDTEQVWDHCAVSFDRNISLWTDGTDVMHSAPIPPDWTPLPLPERPNRILGVGSSPYVDYEGTGSYELEIDYDRGTADLRLRPDARVVGDPWHPSPDRSAVVLEEPSRPFRLKIPGLELRTAKER